MSNKINNKILVSCVGDTDPYRNGFDGAICHIIRKEPGIKKVYLYFSKEIIKGEILNHRYTRAIKFLNPEIEIEIYPKIDRITEYLKLEYTKIDDKKLKEIEEYLENEDKLIKDAHKFDLFYKEFYKMLTDIRNNEQENIEVFFNISSGTPAMKTSLLLMGILEAKKVTKRTKHIESHIVQVASPARGSGKLIPHSVPRNLEEYKNENVENIMNNNLYENFSEEELNELGLTLKDMNRHSLEDSYQTTKIILYNDVKELFENYDYFGVSTLLKKYETILSPKLVSLSNHLGCRISGKVKEAERISREELDMFNELYPIQNCDERKIIEKFNIMKIKNKRDEINDWLLISTPLEENIYIKLLQSIGIQLSDYTDGGYERPRFNLEKLNKKHSEVYKEIKKKLSDISSIKGDINGKILYKIIKSSKIENDAITIEKIGILEKSREYRNYAAHTITYITRDDIEKNMGTLENLESAFKYLIKKSHINLNQDQFDEALNIYTKIENYILEEFERIIKENN